MAAHAAVACNTAVIIIANGNNYYRFTDYSSFHFKNVITLYPKIFPELSENKKESALHYDAVSSDIQTVSTEDVFNSLKKISM